MKTCPFCAEQIKDEAIKCRYCGEMLDGSSKAGEEELFIPLPQGSLVFTTGFETLANKRSISTLTVAKAWVEAQAFHESVGLLDQWNKNRIPLRHNLPKKPFTYVDWCFWVWDIWHPYLWAAIQSYESEGWVLAEPFEMRDGRFPFEAIEVRGFWGPEVKLAIFGASFLMKKSR